MDEEPWSRATLRVWPSGRTVAEIHSALRIDGAQQSDRFWFVEPGPGDMHLDDRLKLVEAILAEKREAFVELAATCETDLLVSWTPKEGQDGVLISANLIKLLGEIGAHIAMDTYTDD